MNVLFVTRAYGKSSGGMERLSYEFIEAAKQHPTIEGTVIAHSTPPNISLLTARLRSVAFAIGVIPRALLAAKHADIIHIGDPVLSFVGWLVKIIHKKPIVVTVHGLDITFSNLLYQLYLRLFFKSFALYLPISEHVAQLLKEMSVSGSVTVLTPGISDEYFDAALSQEHLDSLLEMQTSDFVILGTIGRLVKRKGHAWFIRNVLPQLPETYIYVIAGSGPEISNIRKAVRELGLSKRVLILGRVSNKAARILYNTIDIFVQPNISVDGDNEGFGLVLLEAALCNRHVVASNIEGITSAIHHGKNGMLVPPESPTAWVTALSMKQPVPEPRNYTLLTFSWSRIIEQYVTAISAIGR